MKKQGIKNFIIAGVALIGGGIVGSVLANLSGFVYFNLLWLVGAVVAIIFVFKGIKCMKAARKEAPAKRNQPSKGHNHPQHPQPQNDDDDIVTLTSADGEEIDFVEIAGIALRGKFYAILQPVELLEGMDDDEALVFQVTKDRNGEDHFEIETNDAIVDAVFEEYNRLLDEEMGK